MTEKELKLTTELVPRTAWFSSLRAVYKQHKQLSRWKKLKQILFEKEGRRCWICGAEGVRFEAHEFWEYDDKNHIQRLVAVHHLCHMCHKIKHLGFWTSIDAGIQQMAKMGLTREDLIRHFCEVNDCTREDFDKHQAECVRIWQERSKFNWGQDLGEYAPEI